MRGVAPRKVPVVVIWPKRWTVNVCRAVDEGRLRELGMIQSVKELGAKLQLEPLGDGGGFGERDVEIGQGRTTQHIAAQAVGSVGRVIHRIELRETGIGSASVKVVELFSRGTLEKLLGSKIKLPVTAWVVMTHW